MAVMAAIRPPASHLEAALAPLSPWMGRADVTDLFINRPGEMWVESLGGGIERVDLPALDEERLWLIARQVAAAGHQGISRAQPLLAATLPDGARVQVVAPPATRGGMAIAIRRQAVHGLALGDYSFAGLAVDMGAEAPRPAFGTRAGVMADPAGFLGSAVRARANILVSGGTSTGKTTFLGSLLREIPAHERLVLIEDTPELPETHANSVGLVATRGGMGEAQVSVEDLLQASLRLRPDRIILGELRGGEAASFLRAVNTGHSGSLTSIHADSPEGALEQLALIVMQGGSRLSRAEILHYARRVIDIVVQMERRDGRRHISRIMVMRGEGAQQIL
jgi:type IV secretion system protein VirB11